MNAHPSRSVPLCTDCIYKRGSRCNHPSVPVDPIRGIPLIAAGAMRAALTGFDEHLGVTPCGKAGLLFTPPNQLNFAPMGLLFVAAGKFEVRLK